MDCGFFAISIVLDCSRILLIVRGLRPITAPQSTLQSTKSPCNPQNQVAIENRGIRGCERIARFRGDEFSRIFPQRKKRDYVAKLSVASFF